MLNTLPEVYFLVGGIILIVVLLIAVVRSQGADCSDIYLLQSRRSLEGEPWWERAAVARRMSIDINTCRVCQKPTTTQCSQCKSVKYCGPVCQRKDWGSGHKYECPNLKQQHKAQVEAAGQAKPPFLDPNEDAPVPRQVLFPYDVFLQLRKTSSSCKRAPIGLTNHGNNCYANAALQCLLFTQPLRAYLDQGLHSRQCNKPHDKDWCLLCVLSRLCHEMSEAPLNTEISLKPLLRHLRRFAKTMSYGRQEDAHEFFYSLLNTMEAIQLTNCGGKDRFDMRTQETTLVHHVFGGYLRSQVVCCGCGAASRRYEAALDLQLEVPAGVDRLEDVLERHTAVEVLEGDNCYACDGCKQRCRAKRCTRFEVAPNTLVLCLKRFGTGRFGKINNMLVYGEKLDLGTFMAHGAMDDGPATYTLSGVVVHLDQMNSTSFGHYISFVRALEGNGNCSSNHGQWYMCDDSRVSRTRAADALSQNAYMLFYQRDTAKPAPNPNFKRYKPLFPLTAAQAAAAATAPTTPKAHETIKANGLPPPAAAAAAADHQALPDVQQQDQAPSQHMVEEAVMSVAQERGQQSSMLAVGHSHPPPAALEGSELLPRIATAPAALALLTATAASSSRDDDECGSPLTSSLCLADVSGCSTPSYQMNLAAAASSTPTDTLLASTASKNITRGSSMSSSSSRLSRHSLDQQPEPASTMVQGDLSGPQQLPAHTALRRRQRKQRQQQQQHQGPVDTTGSRQQPADSTSTAVAGTAGEGLCTSNTPTVGKDLPRIQHRLTTAGPELLCLRAQLPGISTASLVRVAVESMSQQSDQQCLWLQVPGHFLELQLPLSLYLQPGQTVAAVSGRFYRKHQLLKLKLCLTKATGTAAADAGKTGSNGGSLGSSNTQGLVRGRTTREEYNVHLTDSFDTSSGSESEGLQSARRGMHAVASERDLCSIFGRHSSAVARQLMQQLQLQQQTSTGKGSASTASAGACPPAAAKKPAAKKKAAGKKKKRK